MNQKFSTLVLTGVTWEHVYFRVLGSSLPPPTPSDPDIGCGLRTTLEETQKQSGMWGGEESKKKDINVVASRKPLAFHV